MEAGIAGTENTLSERAVLLKQAVPDLTVTAPLVKVAGKVTEMLVLPWPLLMTAPAGTDQL